MHACLRLIVCSPMERDSRNDNAYRDNYRGAFKQFKNRIESKLKIGASQSMPTSNSQPNVARRYIVTLWKTHRLKVGIVSAGVFVAGFGVFQNYTLITYIGSFLILFGIGQFLSYWYDTG